MSLVYSDAEDASYLAESAFPILTTFPMVRAAHFTGIALRWVILQVWDGQGVGVRLQN